VGLVRDEIFLESQEEVVGLSEQLVGEVVVAGIG